MKVLLGISGASGAAYGVRTLSLLLARGADLHVLVTKTAWGILAAEVWDGNLPGGMAARRKGLALCAAVLGYEHAIVRKDDLSRLNMAFFNLNGVVSIAFCLFTWLDLVLRGRP